MRKHHTNSKITVRHADGRVEVVPPSAFYKKRRKGAFYREYRRSRHWRLLRRRVLERDGHCCTICKRQHGDTDPRLPEGRTTKLEVHHLTYERIWREPLEDLVSLCQRCHATEHQWRRRVQQAA